MMRIIARPNMSINLGREGENLAREICFDISDWQEEYGLGVARLIARRPCDKSPYPCIIESDGSMVVWPISSVDTAWREGSGECQLQYRVGDVVVKSEIWRTYIANSMDASSVVDPPPSEQGWVEQVLIAAEHAESAADKATTAAIRQPYPNVETGTWWVWDAAKDEYINTGATFSGGGAIAIDKTLTTAGMAADAKVVGNALAAKQDKPDIRTALDDVSIAGAQYYLGVQTDVAIVLPDDAAVGQMVLVSWYNGDTAATLSITGKMLDFDFTPSSNTRSEINALWDGTYWAILSNEMEVPIDSTTQA